MENFKDIPGYEGLYQVSNLGRVKSLFRVVNCKNGLVRTIKERILSSNLDRDGYFKVRLSRFNKVTNFSIHQLVAMAFLNHKPKGSEIVVDHINRDRTDNNLSNLRLVTQRENTNQKHIKSSSKYTGVCWSKQKNKWTSQIVINKKLIYLGSFIDEYEAHLEYQKALKEL